MKMYCFVIVIAFIFDAAESKNGVKIEVNEKLRNSTNIIKEDIKSWWSYGKKLVLGNSYVQQIRNVLEDQKNKTEVAIDNDRSVIEEAFHRIKTRMHAVRLKIHDMILGVDQPNKSFIKSMYKKVKCRISKVRVFISGDDDSELNTNEDPNPEQAPPDYSDQTKLLREKLYKILFGNNTKIFKENYLNGALSNTTSDAEPDISQYQRKFTNNDSGNLADNLKDMNAEAKALVNSIAKRNEHFNRV